MTIYRQTLVVSSTVLLNTRRMLTKANNSHTVVVVGYWCLIHAVEQKQWHSLLYCNTTETIGKSAFFIDWVGKVTCRPNVPKSI